MNWAHVHLMVNHVPVIGILFDACLLAWAVVKRSEELKRASLGIMVVLAAVTPLVYASGEKAAKYLRGMQGVDPVLVSSHEDAALLAAWCIGIAGCFALAGMLAFRRRARLPDWFTVTCLILCLAIVGVMGWTANLGGRIRLPEARPGFSLPAKPAQAGALSTR